MPLQWLGNHSFDSFWNSNGKGKQNSFCAFLVTIFIFFLILVLFIYQLVNCFIYNNVVSSSYSLYATEPPQTIINTEISSSSPTSYMMGFSVLYNNCSTSSTMSIDATYVTAITSSGGPTTYATASINM